MRPGRRLVAAVLCWAGCVHGAALAQEAGRTERDAAAAPVPDEEVIVRGRSRAALRVQIRRAEEAVYDRFNEINSDDELDIHCRQEVFTGSRMLHRICQPNFQRRALEDAGRETVIGLQGGPSTSAQLFAAEAHYKRQLLAGEMRRLAREDEQLLQALGRLMRLEQTMDERHGPGASSSSPPRGLVTGDEESLPYGAARVADARVGREPWRHDLAHRTFTIAQVYGDVSSLEVECGARTRPLAYEVGVEWTLPEDWGACALLVEAEPGTTLAVFEFE